MYHCTTIKVQQIYYKNMLKYQDKACVEFTEVGTGSGTTDLQNLLLQKLTYIFLVKPQQLSGLKMYT